MGYSISWLATRNLSPEELQAHFGSSFLTVAEEPIEGAGNVATQLPSGFTLLFCHDDSELCEDLAKQLSTEEGEVYSASVEEHVMVSILTLWRGEERVWSVMHDGSDGGDDLEVAGEPPPELAELIARCEAQRTAADAYDDVDYVFDVPIDLGKVLVGFRHDELIRPAPGEVPTLIPDPSQRGKRLLAKLVDVLIVGLTIVGFTSLTGSPLVGLLVGYGWLLISDGDSASPGKRLFKLQAVSAANGQPCSFAQSALRNAPLVLVEADNVHRAWLGTERDFYREQFPWIFGAGLAISALYYVVVLIMMYRDPLQRRPGDRFGGTVVRRRRAENPLRG